MIFAPVVREGPYETIGYYDLWMRRAAAQLPPGSSIRDELDTASPEYAAWRELLDHEAKAIDGALRQGSVCAYVMPDSDGRFYRIPPEHWREGGFLEGEPGERLFAWGSSDVPTKFRDLPLLFFVDEVEEWERKLERQLAVSELPWDTTAIDECLEEAGNLREGYWSAWSTLAWVASRDEKFVAAVQLFEERYHANRGDIYACDAWMTLGNKAGEMFGCTFTMAEVQLREKLEASSLRGGIAFDQVRGLIEVERMTWTRWNVRFTREGLVLVPGLSDFRWPSEAVRDAFPAEAALSGSVALDHTLGNRADEEKVKAFSASLDDEQIPIRAVTKALIVSRWNRSDGPLPGVKEVIFHMKGGRRGAPRKIKRPEK